MDWSESRNKVQQEIRMYWTFRADMAVIDGIILERQMTSNTKIATKTGNESNT